MSIEVNSVGKLKNRNSGNKLTLSDSDYVLRDKKKENGKNTRNITGQTSKYQEELARVKAEARRDVEKEIMSSGFIDTLKAQIKAEMEAEATYKTKIKAEKETEATPKAKTTGGK
jgi:hypothetical protein